MADERSVPERGRSTPRLDYLGVVEAMQSGDERARVEMQRLIEDAVRDGAEVRTGDFGLMDTGTQLFIVDYAHEITEIGSLVLLHALLPPIQLATRPSWLPFHLVWMWGRYREMSLALGTREGIETQPTAPAHLRLIRADVKDIDRARPNLEVLLRAQTYVAVLSEVPSIEIVRILRARKRPAIVTGNPEIVEWAAKNDNPHLALNDANPATIEEAIELANDLNIGAQTSLVAKSSQIPPELERCVSEFRWNRQKIRMPLPAYSGIAAALFDENTLAWLRGGVLQPRVEQESVMPESERGSRLIAELTLDSLLDELRELGRLNDDNVRRELTDVLSDLLNYSGPDDVFVARYDKARVEVQRRLPALVDHLEICFLILDAGERGPMFAGTAFPFVLVDLLADHVRRWVVPTYVRVAQFDAERLARLRRLRRFEEPDDRVRFREDLSSLQLELRDAVGDAGEPFLSTTNGLGQLSLTVVSDAPLELAEREGAPLCLRVPMCRLPTRPVADVAAHLANAAYFAKAHVRKDVSPVLIAAGDEDDVAYRAAFLRDSVKEVFDFDIELVQAASASAFEASLAASSDRVVVYYGHAHHDDRWGVSSLVFPDLSRLTDTEFSRLRIPPILGLVGCETEACGALTGGFATRALGSGALAVLATVLPVDDFIAAYFIGRVLSSFYGKDSDFPRGDLAQHVWRARITCAIQEYVRPLVGLGMLEPEEVMELLNTYMRQLNDSPPQTWAAGSREFFLSALPSDEHRDAWLDLESRGYVTRDSWFFTLFGRAHNVF